MTLREQIQSELVVAKAEVATLESHLATGGAWLEMEAANPTSPAPSL